MVVLLEIPCHVTNCLKLGHARLMLPGLRRFSAVSSEVNGATSPAARD